MNDEQQAAAAALGWHLDTSPETELSSEIWYRHGATYELKREEDVLALMERHSCFCPKRDAWRCAVAQNLSTVSCHCACHRYIFQR